MEQVNSGFFLLNVYCSTVVCVKCVYMDNLPDRTVYSIKASGPAEPGNYLMEKFQFVLRVREQRTIFDAGGGL
jgi:hypothetical protein